MRPTGTARAAGTVRRAGLAAAALTLLAACSGGGSSASGSSSPPAPTTSSPPATTTPAAPTGADAVFCQQVSRLVPELSTVQSAPAEQVPGLLQQLVPEVGKIQPPAAIASDWHTLGDALHQLQSALGSVDVTTSEGQAELQRLEKQATASTTAAQGNITSWVLSHCSSGAGSSTAAGGTAATNTG
jgi:hypothetical protein